VTALALAACQQTPEARLYQTQEEMLGQIKVDGFERVQISTFDKAAQGIYVGAPVDDVQSRVSGGGVTLGPAQYGTFWTGREALYTGKGKAPDGTECTVYVERLRAGERPDTTWGLSGRRADEVAAGKQQILIISATCGGA
jgi:hypothetical protein